jgi:hypothetical protein
MRGNTLPTTHSPPHRSRPAGNPPNRQPATVGEEERGGRGPTSRRTSMREAPDCRPPPTARHAQPTRPSSSDSTSCLFHPALLLRRWRVVGWVDILLDVIGGVEGAQREGCPRTMTGVSQRWFSGHFRQVFFLIPMHYPALTMAPTCGVKTSTTRFIGCWLFVFFGLMFSLG